MIERLALRRPPPHREKERRAAPAPEAVFRRFFDLIARFGGAAPLITFDPGFETKARIKRLDPDDVRPPLM